MKLQAALLSLLLLFTLSSAMAQCVADDGPDRVKCTNFALPAETLIGPEDGPVQDYTYAWEAYHERTIGPYTAIYTASIMLNDSSLANPEVTVMNIEEPVDFILHVTDNEGNTCTDTMTVRFSSFNVHLGYLNLYISMGDSIFCTGLSNISGGIEPVEYLWRPNHGLTDSTGLSFWAKPVEDTYYYLTITDSAGCVAVGSPVYRVHVHPVSVAELETEEGHVSVHPNPATESIRVMVPESIHDQMLFEVMDISGKIVLQRSLSGLHRPLGLGLYLAQP
jgi:hypothetical protein